MLQSSAAEVEAIHKAAKVNRPSQSPKRASVQDNMNPFTCLCLFLRRNATFSALFLVFVLLLLITRCSPKTIPLVFPQRRVCRFQEPKKSMPYGAEPKTTIHDAILAGELLLVQDFLLAQPSSVNERKQM